METPRALTRLALQPQYRTGANDPVKDFYQPCLEQSISYDRAVGYFRSTVYLIVGAATAAFAKRGGRIRLVCSPSLSNEDQVGISLGYELRKEQTESILIREIESLLGSADTSYRTRVLATLIATNSLEIKIATRSEGSSGIYHEKIGIFTDIAGNLVSFLGSSNETWNGWHFLGNHEAIEVFSSWSGENDRKRAARHSEYFENLWNNRVNGLQLMEFPEAAKTRLLQARLADLDYEEDPPNSKKGTNIKRSPLPHQEAALREWERNQRRGVFEHATGSGKTFLAITAIAQQATRGWPTLVLVPSALLLKQWAEEIGQEIPDATILLAGAGNQGWQKGARLRAMTHPEATPEKRIVVATMQTAATDTFNRAITDGKTLLIVADEVHQIGSDFNAKSLLIDARFRMGLSATPRRYGDPAGTERIFDYFGPVLEPRVTLNEAIKAGRLVPYEYYPHTVRLTNEESDQWRRITRQLTLEIARASHGADSSRSRLTEKAKLLLIQRSRIAKKAEGKVALATSAISDNYRAGQRWLIYCEDQSQLSEVIESMAALGHQAVEYHTQMSGDPEAAMQWFRTVGGILVSIKCLDEGVDIPSADHALILASSQNPRQFIQRRGRVLRKSPGKHVAIIHDALVIPLSIDEEPSQVALLRSELSRALEFAQSGLNLSASAELRSIAIELGIDAENLQDVGIEEEDL